MAPAKPPPSSISAKSLDTSMSPPISLLWAHQLRREHNALLGRLEDLANAVSNVSAAKLDKIAALTTRAEERSTDMQSEQMKFKEELDRIGERDKDHDEEIATLRVRLDVSEKNMLAVQNDVRTREEKFKKHLINRIAAVESELHVDQEERDRQVYNLKAEIGDVQRQLPDITNEGIIVVKDSVEEIRAQMNQNAAHISCPQTRMTDGEALHASGLVQPTSEPTEMLTLLRDPDGGVDPCPPGDIDLDEDVPMHESDANEVGGMLERDTMAMLPEVKVADCQQGKDPTFLKQGKLQSWDRYVAACADVIDKVPKRKEGVVVEAFVDGIYNEKLRGKCETMLDETGWTFKSVKDFVDKHVSGEMETLARQRTGVFTHKHSKGQVCPVCPKKANVARDGNLANSPQNTLFQAVPRPQTAPSKRRSQRIHLQSQENQVVPSTIMDPASPDRSARKPVEKPLRKSVQKETPVETRTMIGTAKRERPATESNEPRPAWGGRDINLGNPPARNQQQQKLRLATTDHRAGHDMHTTSHKRPGTEKPSLQQETRAPATSDTEPNTPPNPAVLQHRLDRRNKNAVNTTTYPDSRQGLQMESSKKRKLVEQLEVPAGALVTPLDERIEQEQDGAEEDDDDEVLERRKRLTNNNNKKKRRRRAVVPIPKIPILPLSDDD